MRTIAEEEIRAKQARENAKTVFSTSIRDVEINSIKDGDILIFSENYAVIDRPVRGTNDIAELTYIKCIRNDKEITIPFYPCFFYKTRQLADEITKRPTGVFLQAKGEVVDFVQSRGNINEAIKSIAIYHPSGVLVHFGNEKTLRFGEPEDGTGRLQNANIPTLTWAPKPNGFHTIFSEAKNTTLLKMAVNSFLINYPFTYNEIRNLRNLLN